MTLPGAVRAQVEARLGKIEGAEPVGGGCVSRTVRLRLGAGSVFLKFDPAAPPGLFAAEAEGLQRLREAAAALVVPRVLELGEGEPSWLALEWLEAAPASPAGWERLGCGLASLHARREPGWGGGRDGFIGPLPQENAPAGEWAAFWRERRLEPQLRRARGAGWTPGSEREWDRLLAALPSLLEPATADGPSLLHGDLWSGNALHTAAGPALVDPASYPGHREVDLSMAELFGGFPAAFWEAYRERAPLRPGYAEARRPVYQLYYLLVHVNLFGAAYVERTASTLRAALVAA